MTDRLRIVHLTARHVLGLREANLDIGNGREVHGKNGSGKSSIAAALSALVLRGGGAVQAIGEADGEVIAQLVGEDGKKLEIHRKIGNGVSVLESRGEFRSKVSKPQAFVESLFGALTFDPLAFARAAPRDQREMFCSAFPCSIDGVEGARDLADRYGVATDGHGMTVAQDLATAIFEARHLLGQEKTRKAKAAEEAAPARREVRYDAAAHEGARDDVAAARHALAGLEAENDRTKARNRDLDSARDQIDHMDRESARMRAEAARLIALADELDRKAATARDQCGKRQPDPLIDRSDLEAKLAEAEDRAAGFTRDAEAAQAVERWRKLEEEAEQKDAEYRALTEQLDQVRGPITVALARQIECGIPDVSIDGEDIKVGGVPVRTLNRQQQVRFGVQVSAALCRDKPVRFVVVDNAESITDGNRKQLAAECEALGLQWLFLVASEGATPEGAVRVEDGVVATEVRPIQGEAT